MTAGAAASEVTTVRLTTQLLLDGRLQRNYADVTISASEDALSSVAQTFSVVQPPDKTSDQVRDRDRDSFWVTPRTPLPQPGSRTAATTRRR